MEVVDISPFSQYDLDLVGEGIESNQETLLNHQANGDFGAMLEIRELLSRCCQGMAIHLYATRFQGFFDNETGDRCVNSNFQRNATFGSIIINGCFYAELTVTDGEVFKYVFVFDMRDWKIFRTQMSQQVFNAELEFSLFENRAREVTAREFPIH